VDYKFTALLYPSAAMDRGMNW